MFDQETITPTAAQQPTDKQTANGPVSSSEAQLGILRELAMDLLGQVERLKTSVEDRTEGPVENFYDEVRNFEIKLIRHALLQTNGHQLRAAKLLGIKATTLNMKMKRYKLTQFSSLPRFWIVSKELAR